MRRTGRGRRTRRKWIYHKDTENTELGNWENFKKPHTPKSLGPFPPSTDYWPTRNDRAENGREFTAKAYRKKLRPIIFSNFLTLCSLCFCGKSIPLCTAL